MLHCLSQFVSPYELNGHTETLYQFFMDVQCYPIEKLKFSGIQLEPYKSFPLLASCQVAVIAPNVPAMYEAHFGIPMAGAVLNAVNVRLNADTIAFLLGHCSAAVVMVDQEFFPLAEEALEILENKSEGKSIRPLIVVIADKNCDPAPF